MQECQEDKGFQISCLNCGSKDCDQLEDYDVCVIVCKNCGQQE